MKILLLHGAIGAKTQMTPLSERLATHGIEVHTLDFEGHGRAPSRDRPFWTDHFGENVIEYLDEKNIDQINLFGHSMGGLVALWVAQHHAERVGRIFTLGVKFVWSPEVAQKEHRNLMPEKIEEKVPHFAAALNERHQALDWKENMALSRQMMTALGDRPPDISGYAAVAQPVVIGIGDRDRMTTLAESMAVYEALPNGALQVFPHTKHPLEQIDIDMLADALFRFIK